MTQGNCLLRNDNRATPADNLFSEIEHTEMNSEIPDLTCWTDQVVIVETDTDKTFIGTLVENTSAGLKLTDGLLFDQAHHRVPLEQFLIECAEHGLSSSRRSQWVRIQRVIAVSPLAEIVIPGRS
ncbi:MAG TPA: hypothetical protein DCR55_11550 [Lentisphaeria bacterium]|jgi:hypothetical protein|nr:hypothetical protein [Lentisphaeria bacterium]